MEVVIPFSPEGPGRLTRANVLHQLFLKFLSLVTVLTPVNVLSPVKAPKSGIVLAFVNVVILVKVLPPVKALPPMLPPFLEIPALS